MEKILVTGGSGFIGTNLVKFLLEKGEYEVLNLDISQPKLREYDGVWRKVDLCDKNQLVETIRGFRPDCVIHLAARTDLRGKNLEDYDANMTGVSNLLCKFRTMLGHVFR